MKLVPPQQLARRVKLHYYSDDRPGIRRDKVRGGFAYFSPAGRPITDERLIARIERLVIPPAWTDVWICPSASGHLQATGRDARGRKQYLYHARWQEVSNRTKFQHLRRFGEGLPKLRRQVRRDLALRGHSHRKIVATIVDLLDRTMIRIGNEEYARTNGSFGLTTLRDRHVQINGSKLRFCFQGKSGKPHAVELADKRLARIVRRCQELPGQVLFQYLDDQGRRRRIGSGDVNAYLRSVLGHSFTAKDFRTWKATTLVWQALRAQGEVPLSPTAARRAVNQAIRNAAGLLNHTVTVCRNYYVHPDIVAKFLDGKLKCPSCNGSAVRGLDPCEQELLRLLRATR